MKTFLCEFAPVLYALLVWCVEPYAPDNLLPWIQAGYLVYLIASFALYAWDGRYDPDGEFFINGTNEDGMPIMLNETLDSIHGKRYLILKVIE